MNKIFSFVLILVLFFGFGCTEKESSNVELDFFNINGIYIGMEREEAEKIISQNRPFKINNVITEDNYLYRNGKLVNFISTSDVESYDTLRTYLDLFLELDCYDEPKDTNEDDFSRYCLFGNDDFFLSLHDRYSEEKTTIIMVAYDSPFMSPVFIEEVIEED